MGHSDDTPSNNISVTKERDPTSSENKMETIHESTELESNKLGNKNSLCNIWVEYFYCNHFVRSEMIISTPDK